MSQSLVKLESPQMAVYYRSDQGAYGTSLFAIVGRFHTKSYAWKTWLSDATTKTVPRSSLL